VNIQSHVMNPQLKAEIINSDGKKLRPAKAATLPPAAHSELAPPPPLMIPTSPSPLMSPNGT
jgi:hypothetical protein